MIKNQANYLVNTGGQGSDEMSMISHFFKNKKAEEQVVIGIKNRKKKAK